MRISKKTWLTLLGFLVSGLLLFIFVQNDAFLYQRPLGKIVAVKTEKTEKTTDAYNNNDQVTRQRLTFVLLNSKYKGQKVQVTSTYSSSGALDQKYRVGQQVFLDIHERKGKLDASIADYKRDVYLFMLSFAVIFLLYLTMRFHGIKTLLSVVLNFILFLLAVELDVRLNLTNFFWIFVAFAVIFTALSLALVIGLNRQCLITFSSIMLSTTLALAIGCLTLYLTKSQGIHYEALDYATQSPKQLFFAATVIGLLGAVMDAATDIVSTLFEMKKSQPKTSRRQLFLSGRAVGRAIMGPLINVLLLIFFAEAIALSVVYFKTGNSIAYTFEWTMALGVVQALISGIGIVLTIPVASFLSAYSLGGQKHVSD